MKKILLTCMTLVILISSCSGEIASHIIGKWECSRLNQVLEIEPDGMVRLIDTKLGYSEYEGTYSLQGKKILFTFPRFSRPVSRTIKTIQDNKLVLLDGNGIEELYIRKH